MNSLIRSWCGNPKNQFKTYDISLDYHPSTLVHVTKYRLWFEADKKYTSKYRERNVLWFNTLWTMEKQRS